MVKERFKYLPSPANRTHVYLFKSNALFLPFPLVSGVKTKAARKHGCELRLAYTE